MAGDNENFSCCRRLLGNWNVYFLGRKILGENSVSFVGLEILLENMQNHSWISKIQDSFLRFLINNKIVAHFSND